MCERLVIRDAVSSHESGGGLYRSLRNAGTASTTTVTLGGRRTVVRGPALTLTLRVPTKAPAAARNALRRRKTVRATVTDPDRALRTLVFALKERWRGHDEKVLARDEASSGVLLLAINSTEKTGGTDAIVAGILDSGHDGEPITIRGQKAKLVRTADDSYFTAGVAGECAALLIFASSETQARNAVKQIVDG